LSFLIAIDKTGAFSIFKLSRASLNSKSSYIASYRVQIDPEEPGKTL